MRELKKNKLKKNTSSTGAAKRRQRQLTGQRSRARQFLKFVVTGAACGIICATSLLAYQWFDKASFRPVSDMSISSSFSLLSTEEIAAIVEPMIERGELRVALGEVSKTLQESPWIDAASVSWRWPGRLNISVVEQVPIARWGENGFVNSRGEFVVFPEQEVLQNLPLLSGSVGQEREVMENFQKFSQLLRSENLKIAELSTDELMNWKMVLKNGPAIMIGRDQVMEKIQRFVFVFQQGLDSRLMEIEQIDLRYGNGVAVSWKNDGLDGTSQDLQIARVSERRGG